MKTRFLIIAVALLFAACGGGNKNGQEGLPERSNVTEILYFHGAKSCASCVAMERATEELLKEVYAKEVEAVKLIYTNADLVDDEALAEKYGVVWASLLVIDYDNEGNESVTDQSDNGYLYGISDPERLKAELRTTIDAYLNN